MAIRPAVAVPFTEVDIRPLIEVRIDFLLFPDPAARLVPN
jgi:hypothetical protein